MTPSLLPLPSPRGALAYWRVLFIVVVAGPLFPVAALIGAGSEHGVLPILTMSRWRVRATLCGLVGVLAVTMLMAGIALPVWGVASAEAAATAGPAVDEPIDYEKEKDAITEPKPITKAPPKYPEEARADKVQGTVVLRAVIAKDGTIEKITVKRTDDERFSQAAIDALEQWQFEPATRNGEPVAVWYVLTFKFALE